MRVLITLSSLQVGGAERNVVAVLPYLQRQGIDVALCTMRTSQDSFLAEILQETDVPRIDLGARRLLDADAFRRFLQVITEFRADIVHGEDQDASLLCAAASRTRGIPFIYTRHNEREEVPTIRSRIRAALVLHEARRAVRVIAVSDAIRLFLQQNYAVDPNRIVTIYNGIDLQRFAVHKPREMKRAELGWPKESFIVIMVAVIRRDKGHDVLFDAARAICVAMPSVRIKIVGDGPWAAQRQIEAASLGDVVEFLGARDDVPDLLAAADLLVHPSRTEALPTAPIEAGAAGLPVVATDVGGTREIVENGITGYLVGNGDARALADRILRILGDRGLAMQMGKAAQERVGRLFNLDQQAERTANLYEQVLASS